MEIHKVEDFGEITKLTLAKTKSESLRTTVPMSIVRQFTLKAGDRIGWKIDIKNGELVVVVRPIKSSSGNRGVSTENLRDSKTAIER
jgi:bifunctional DNA-binding transcriptional regulator/antitoxin component of YhaV-PrlF toxin-antitoxin module